MFRSNEMKVRVLVLAVVRKGGVKQDFEKGVVGYLSVLFEFKNKLSTFIEGTIFAKVIIAVFIPLTRSFAEVRLNTR